MSDGFDELVGEIDDRQERERLRRVHELLLSVDAPPERSPTFDAAVLPEPVQLRPRRHGRALALLAAALTLAAFGAGYLVGGRDDAPERVISMAGTGSERDATASIEVLPQDKAGNWPMHVLVRGLEPSKGRSDYYELWLTEDGKPTASCGRFVVAAGLTTVTLTVPYALRRYNGWIVTRAGSDEVLLTT